MSILGAIVKGIEIAAEATVRMYEARKDESARKVRIRTNDLTARKYRELLDAMDTLTSTEKKFVVEELMAMAKIEQEVKVVTVEKVAMATTSNPDDGWTEGEIRAFDGDYNAAKKWGYENIAEYIKNHNTKYTINKSLVEIQQRVLYYKSMGL